MTIAQLSSVSSVARRVEPADIYLDGTGLIRRCSGAVEALFGYSAADVMWQPISKLLPDFSSISLFKDGQLNPMVNYLCRCGHLFRAQGKGGASFDSELFFITLPSQEKTVRLIVKPCC